MEIENTFSTSVPGKNLKIKDYRLVFLFLKNKKWKPPPGHFQFLIFDFQNIENCFPISCFLETKIDDWDCKFVIFNSWGIKHWKSRLWIFDFQFSIWNKNQMDENHTDHQGSFKSKQRRNTTFHRGAISSHERQQQYTIIICFLRRPSDATHEKCNLTPLRAQIEMHKWHWFTRELFNLVHFYSFLSCI